MAMSLPETRLPRNGIPPPLACFALFFSPISVTMRPCFLSFWRAALTFSASTIPLEGLPFTWIAL
jgi:hypothetical protein